MNKTYKFVVNVAICMMALFMTLTTLHAITLEETEKLVEKNIKTFLIQKMPFLRQEDITVNLENLKSIFPEDTFVTHFTLPELTKDKHLLGKTLIPIVFYQQTKVLSKKRVIANSSAHTYFIQTTQKITKGMVIKHGQIEKKYLPILGNPKNGFHQLKNVLHKEAKVTLAKGTILTPYLIRPTPVIHKGDHISYVIKQDYFEIKGKGTALEDGYIGQKIRVKTLLDAQKKLTGVIVDANTVKLFSTN